MDGEPPWYVCMYFIGDHNGAQKLVIIFFKIFNFYKWLNKGLSTFSVVFLCLVTDSTKYLCFLTHSLTHSLMLSLSSGNMSVDAQLFIFTLTEDEQPHQLIAYTQHRSPNHRWVCQLDLDGGSYALVPYTTGCFLKPRERGPVAPQPVPLVDEEDGRIKLTPACM